ncbi:MAG: type I restriction enzyme HsdR N-terminal domain-containing protein [Candidatus Latescibacterota bacterium]
MLPADLPPLRFPRPYALDLRRIDDRLVVFDPLRRRCVPLTPEEWVRQHLLQFLIQDRGCPEGLVAVERALSFYGKPLRADVVVHDRRGRPLLLAECKEPAAKVDEAAFRQAADYNRVLRAPFLLVTNGLTHSCCQWEPGAGTWHFLEDLPTYPQMLAAGAS